MSGSQITIPASQLDAQRLGYQAISLTHYDDNLEPQIAAGSKVEIGGALFQFTANESITGWGGIGVSNDVYIKLTVAGAAVTASFTTAAPTWSTSKQGFYVAAERYIGGLYKDAAGDYELKWLYSPADAAELPALGKVRPVRKKIIEIGDWNMDTLQTLACPHGIADFRKIRTIQVFIRGDVGGVYENYLIPLTEKTYFAGIDSGGVFNLFQTDIRLYRVDTSGFDSAQFDSTPFNRGWIMIEYEA